MCLTWSDTVMYFFSFWPIFFIYYFFNDLHHWSHSELHGAKLVRAQHGADLQATWGKAPATALCLVVHVLFGFMSFCIVCTAYTLFVLMPELPPEHWCHKLRKNKGTVCYMADARAAHTVFCQHASTTGQLALDHNQDGLSSLTCRIWDFFHHRKC